MSKLLLTFYGDDFTGSTDALEQLTLAGIRTALFIEPPTATLLARFQNLQAVGVAGMTRSMSPSAMEKVLRPAFKQLRALGARHVHYKVCSTFDSSPQVGSIGRVIDVAMEIFRAPFVPLLVAAPALGRYTIFGNHYARYGIGSAGQIHRLDRHPSVSKHAVTPMQEADLARHLARQTRKKIALFDILQVGLPAKEARAALKRLLVGKPDVILFDAVNAEHLAQIGGLMDNFATAKQPLFSVGSSGVEMALGSLWAKKNQSSQITAASTKQILVGSGSCSPVTSGQIEWALKHGFAEVPLNIKSLISNRSQELERATQTAGKFLKAGRSVIVHTTRSGSDKRVARQLKNNTARILGMALGEVLRGALEHSPVQRLCIAGGDTSSFAARALGIEAVEMIARLTPGAPLCRAFAPDSPVDGREVVFKGGQVGTENYFEIVKRGKNL